MISQKVLDQFCLQTLGKQGCLEMVCFMLGRKLLRMPFLKNSS